jgi:ribosomal protein L11 methyltransferase
LDNRRADVPALDVRFDAADESLTDRLSAALDDFDPAAIQESGDGAHWRVFFRTAALREAARQALAAALPFLDLQPIDIPDDNWARRSQADLRAVDVGGLVVAPPWDARHSKPVIVIDPSMGFGTGHHATTRLCLRLMQRLDLRGARVIDVGTGSGVLALAAWKLGAGDIAAVDNDPDALDNARGNFGRNGAGGAIDVVPESLERLQLERADVVTANLTAAVLVRHAPRLESLLRDNGVLVVSGFGPDDVPDIRRAFRRQVTEALHEEEWTALLLAPSSS